jgi:hypothetical protein
MIWPDFPLAPGRLEALIPPQALPFINPNIQKIQRTNSETRNPVYRVWSGGETRIVKWFLPELDPFYDSRYRREEKVLWLLNRWFSGRVPQLYGGLISSDQAVLVEQDVGEQSLDVLLDAAPGSAERFQLAGQGVDFLVDFHRVCQENYGPFYRTCYSVVLDRLTHKIYLRRAQIALGRLLLLQDFLRKKISARRAVETSAAQLVALATDRLGAEFFQHYAAQVVAPLMRAPRQILHNSLSPFHLFWADKLYLIDFETMSVGAAQVDLAELVGSPQMRLESEQRLALVQAYYRSLEHARRQHWPEFLANYYNALASRSLDYVGTTAIRYLRFIAQNSEEKALSDLRRLKRYRQCVVEALANVPAPELARSMPRV